MCKLKNGLKVLNATGHNILLLHCKKLHEGSCYGGECFSCTHGEIEKVKPSGFLIKADIVEKVVDKVDDIESNHQIGLVTVDFEPRSGLQDTVNTLIKTRIILGSMIAARAYAGKVVTTIPVSTPGETKLVRADKFTVFPKKGGDVDAHCNTRN